MNFSHRTKNLIFVIGLLLVGIGLGCNEWLLTQIAPGFAKTTGSNLILSPENRVRIWIFDVFFVLIGSTLTLTKYRSNLRLRKLSDLLIGIFLTIGLLILVEGTFYALNTFKGNNSSRDTVYQVKSGTELKGLIEPDEQLGFKLIPNNQLIVTESLNGQLLYKATYTIDEYGRRLTPIDHPDERTRFILFFTDSFAFGFGINDDKTLPFYTGQLATQYRPYNYGVNAYGPQQLLAKLEQDGLREQVKEDQGILIYIYLNYHVDRVIGSMSAQKNFGDQMPYYTLDGNDKLVREGNIISGRPVTSFMYSLLGASQVVSYFGLDFPQINDYHLKITARMIEEARHNFRAKFNSDDFYVLIYPGQRANLTAYFEDANIKYLDYSHLFDPSQKGLNIEGDGHPTAQAYKIVAEKLVNDLDLADSQ